MFGERVRRVSAPSLRVMDNAVGTSLPQRHVQRLEHEFGAQRIGHRPAHDPAVECIDDECEEQESGPGRSVGDIGDPERLGCVGLESTLDEVRCATSRIVSARSARCLALRSPCQAYPSSQSSHALASDMGTGSGELGVNSRRPVGAAVMLMNGADARLEHIIALPASRRFTVSPRVQPDRGDAEHAGHRDDAVTGLIRFDELERFPGTKPVSRANQTAALASISRSSRRWRFSRRRRRSSSRSALVHPSSQRPSSSSAWPAQWRIWSGPSTRTLGRALQSRAPSGPAPPSGGETQAGTAGMFVVSWIPPP